MNRETIQLLGRVSRIVGGHHEWFEAMQEWYGYTELTLAALEALLGTEGRCRLTITVNGRAFEEGYSHVDPRFHRVHWTLPAALLHEGENEITVALEPGSTAPLLLESAAAGAPGHPGPLVRLTVPDPQRSSDLALASCRRAGYESGRGCWAVQPDGGRVEFTLWLRRPADVGFTLNLAAAPARGGAKLLSKLIDKVLDAVEDRLRESAEQARQASREGEAERRRAEAQLNDLRAYARLHRIQLEAAVRGGPEMTLQGVIQITGDPDALVASTAEPILVLPVPQQAPATVVPVRPPPPPRRAVPVGGGAAPAAVGAGRVVLWLVLILVVGGGVAVYVAWRTGSLSLPWLNGQANGAAGDLKRREEDIARRLAEKKAGTGEVQIALGWENKNDLDLHVVAPSGEVIFHGRRLSKCGGRLDVDMNVGLAGASARPVENVFWEKAPRGRYQVWVNHFNNHGTPECQDPTRFTVVVRVRGQAQAFPGEVVRDDAARRKVLVHEFVLD